MTAYERNSSWCCAVLYVAKLSPKGREKREFFNSSDDIVSKVSKSVNIKYENYEKSGNE